MAYDSTSWSQLGSPKLTYHLGNNNFDTFFY